MAKQTLTLTALDLPEVNKILAGDPSLRRQLLDARRILRESGEVAGCKRREVDDGTEVDMEMAVKVTRYIPRQGRGRMYMTPVGATWKDEDVGGTVELAGATMIVTVARSENEPREHYKIDPKSFIAAAVKVFREGSS